MLQVFANLKYITEQSISLIQTELKANA